MKARCGNPNADAYHDYGARGITVCDAWMDFGAFHADMGEPPPGSTLERRDNALGYSPENCVWASRTEQGRNKRNNRLLTIGGETLPMSAWAERYGVKIGTIHRRLKTGWSPMAAVLTPPLVMKTGGKRGEHMARGARNDVVWTDTRAEAA